MNLKQFKQLGLKSGQWVQGSYQDKFFVGKIVVRKEMGNKFYYCKVEDGYIPLCNGDILNPELDSIKRQTSTSFKTVKYVRVDPLNVRSHIVFGGVEIDNQGHIQKVTKKKEKKEEKEYTKPCTGQGCITCDEIRSDMLRNAAECTYTKEDKPIKSLSTLEIGDEVENCHGYSLWVDDIEEGVNGTRYYCMRDCDDDLHYYTIQLLEKQQYRLIKSESKISIIDEMIEFFEKNLMPKRNEEPYIAHNERFNKFITYLKELKNGK